MSKKVSNRLLFLMFLMLCVFPQRSVKMVVSMEEGVLLPTDACVHTASPGPSVREVMSATQQFSAVLNTYPTVNSSLQYRWFRTHCCWSAFFFNTWHVEWLFYVSCHWLEEYGLLWNMWRNYNFFSTSALRRRTWEWDAAFKCLLAKDLPSSCGCFLAHGKKGSKIYKHTQAQRLMLFFIEIHTFGLDALRMSVAEMTSGGQSVDLITLMLRLAVEILLKSFLVFWRQMSESWHLDDLFLWFAPTEMTLHVL